MTFANTRRPTSRPSPTQNSTSTVRDPRLPSGPDASTRDANPSQCVWRNVIGYHNSIPEHVALDVCSLPSPTYESAIGPRKDLMPRLLPRSEERREKLPEYSCSVAAEGPLTMKLEYTSPFDQVHNAQWLDVYVVLRGTLLSVHQPKTGGFFGKASKSERTSETAGRLIKRYTMQHAEVGMASDLKKIEWVPRSNITRYLPASTLEHLLQTEPHHFKPVRQYCIRLRLETDQFLLRYKSHDHREEWLIKLCAAIDIAPALDDRSEPRIVTLPRRPRNRRAGFPTEIVNPPSTAVVAVQEHILRAHYPHLVSRPRDSIDPVSINPNEDEASQEVSATNSDPDRDELDPSFYTILSNVQRSPEGTSGGSQAQPQPQSNTTANGNVRLRTQNSHPLPPDKWAPQLYIDRVQERLYIRRILPVLLINSRRANDLLICDGKRLKVHWEERVLKPYPDSPPPYEFINICRSDSAACSTLLSMQQFLKMSPSKSSGRNNGADSGLSPLSVQSTASLLIADKIDGPMATMPGRSRSRSSVSPGGTTKKSRSTWAERVRKRSSRRNDIVPGEHGRVLMLQECAQGAEREKEMASVRVEALRLFGV